MQIIDEIKGIKSTYTIKTIVQHNEQSNIKLGIDQKTHKKVAIKMQRNIESNELLLLKKFSEQGGFKNVVNIFEVIEGQNSEYFVIMEYAIKGDLRKYLEKNNQMNSQQRKQIILQVAQGLGELHQQNLVHRNISPENILVFQSQEQNSQVQYKLTDFCYLQDKNISKTTNIGTPYYMAPELLRDFNNKQNYKQEVDIWALGCIYYEIITQYNLFQGTYSTILGNSQNQVIQNINSTKQEWINNQIDQLFKYNVIERQRKLLKLMISIDPQRRPNILDVIKNLNGSENFINKVQPLRLNLSPQNSHVSIIKINSNTTSNVSQQQQQQQQQQQLQQQQQQNLEQQQIDALNQIKREYEDKLKQQEENLKNQFQHELEEQQSQLTKEFEQQQFKTENEKQQQEQEQVLIQKNQQLRTRSDIKLKNQQELQKQQIQEQMDQQMNQIKLQFEAQRNELQSQIRNFQQAQIKQIENYIKEYNEFENQIVNIKSQIAKFDKANQNIREQLFLLTTYFQTNQINLEVIRQSGDQTQISDYIEVIKQNIKQLNEYIQKINLSIQKEQFIQSTGIEKQKRLDLIKCQFLQSKADLEDEFKSQFQQINVFILGKGYLEKIVQQDCLNIEQQYENDVKQLNQFVEFQDFTEVQRGIEMLKEKSKQLKQLFQNILDKIKEKELIQNEQINAQNIQTRRFQSLQKHQIEDQQNEIYQLKQIQFQEFQLQKETVSKLIQEMESINLSNHELKYQLQAITFNFLNDVTDFEKFDQNTITSEQLTRMIQKIGQLYQQLTQLKTKIKFETQQMQITQTYFKKEIQFYLQKIEDFNKKSPTIDQKLKQDIVTINEKFNDQLQQIYGSQEFDSVEERIAQINNQKQQLISECNLIIEQLLVTSSEQNLLNTHFSQNLSNYKQKLQTVIEVITQVLFQYNHNLVKLQQISSQTYEINSYIQHIQKYQKQYEEKLKNYSHLLQQQFDQKQLSQIQIDSDEIMKQQGQIEIQSKYSQNQYLMIAIHESKTKLENEYTQLQEFLKQRQNKMNEIICNMLKEQKTIKTQDECEQILNDIFNGEQIENDFQQFMRVVNEIHHQNTQEQKSFSDIDIDLRKIDQQVINMNQYTQNLKDSEQKDLEQFEEALKFTPLNQKNYSINQVTLEEKIVDQVLVRKILQMKDQQMENEQIQLEKMTVYMNIQNRIFNSLLK